MFRNKRENSGLEWFRVDVGATSLYGYKTIDGSLYLEIKYLDSTKCVKIDAECTDKLVEWMMRTYPRKKAEVLRIVPNNTGNFTPGV